MKKIGIILGCVIGLAILATMTFGQRGNDDATETVDTFLTHVIEGNGDAAYAMVDHTSRTVVVPDLGAIDDRPTGFTLHDPRSSQTRTYIPVTLTFADRPTTTLTLEVTTVDDTSVIAERSLPALDIPTPQGFTNLTISSTEIETGLRAGTLHFLPGTYSLQARSETGRTQMTATIHAQNAMQSLQPVLDVTDQGIEDISTEAMDYLESCSTLTAFNDSCDVIDLRYVVPNDATDVTYSFDEAPTLELGDLDIGGSDNVHARLYLSGGTLTYSYTYAGQTFTETVPQFFGPSQAPTGILRVELTGDLVEVTRL